MANEISASLSLSFTKGGASCARNSGSLNVTVAGNGYQANVQPIGTVDETLNLGDVATPGFILLHNADTVNFITLGEDGSSYPIKLKPGEWALVRWNGAAIHAKADTAEAKLEYYLIED